MTDNYVNPKKSGKRLMGLVAGIVLLLLLVIVGMNSFFTISEGFVAAVYTFNRLESVETATGVHFKVPFVQDVTQIDVREQSIEVPQNAYTRDTQTVENLVVKVNYSLNVSQIAQIIQETGVSFVYDKIIEPNVLSITRNTIGQYAADALIENRAEIAQAIQSQLDSIFASKGVTLSAFTIQNIDFEDSFEEAVRRKVEAEQKALEAQNQTREKEELGKQQVIAAQAEADAIKAKAEAEAYSIRTKAEAEAYAVEVINDQLMGNPDYIQYLYAIGWNGQLPMVQGEGASPIIDIRGLQTQTRAPVAALPATPAPEN